MAITIRKAALIAALATFIITSAAVAAYMTLASPGAARAAAVTPALPGSFTSGTAFMQSPGWMMGFSGSNNGPIGWGGPVTGGGPFFEQSQVNISVGTKITITSTQGTYFVAGTPSENGTASGTLTFTVTGSLSSGYTLSVTSGSVTVAGTTYTITSGSAQMNRGASGISGQGATSPTGDFILQATARGSFVGSTAQVSLDLQSGSSEWFVFLTGTITS